jgi:hypothetical protein
LLTISCTLFQKHHHPINLYKTVDEKALTGSGNIQVFGAEKPKSDNILYSFSEASSSFQSLQNIRWKSLDGIRQHSSFLGGKTNK